MGVVSVGVAWIGGGGGGGGEASPGQRARRWWETLATNQIRPDV